MGVESIQYSINRYFYGSDILQVLIFMSPFMAVYFRFLKWYVLIFLDLPQFTHGFICVNCLKVIIKYACYIFACYRVIKEILVSIFRKLRIVRRISSVVAQSRIKIDSFKPILFLFSLHFCPFYLFYYQNRLNHCILKQPV